MKDFIVINVIDALIKNKKIHFIAMHVIDAF